MMKEQNHSYDTGVIHGRFQILHNDHLKYLLAGKSLCRHLVVGITNPEPEMIKAEAVDPKRSDPLSNPLTYYERYCLVRTGLEDAGVNTASFSIVPLPINLPERYRHYVPMDAVFFVSIYDGWGERKLHYFESLGLQTHILRRVPLSEKGLSASDIRQRIMNDAPWEDLVPPSVYRLLVQWRLPERLKTAMARSVSDT